MGPKEQAMEEMKRVNYQRLTGALIHLAKTFRTDTTTAGACSMQSRSGVWSLAKLEVASTSAELHDKEKVVAGCVFYGCRGVAYRSITHPSKFTKSP